MIIKKEDLIFSDKVINYLLEIFMKIYNLANKSIIQTWPVIFNLKSWEPGVTCYWWSVLTNQRPVFRSRDYYWPIRGVTDDLRAGVRVHLSISSPWGMSHLSVKIVGGFSSYRAVKVICEKHCLAPHLLKLVYLIKCNTK